MATRTAIIGGIAVIAILGIAIAFLFFRSPEISAPPIQGGLPAAGGGQNLSSAPSASVAPPSFSGAPTLSGQKAPSEAQGGQGGYEIFGTTIQLPSFLQVFKPFSPIAAPETQIKMPAPLAASTTSVSAANAPALTPEEVFQTLYPSFFINGLRDVQNQLISEGVVSSSAAASFATENDIEAFLLSTGSYLAAQGALSADDFSSFQKDIHDFFDRPYSEKLKEAESLLSEKAGSVPPGTVFPTQREALDEFYRTTHIKDSLSPDAAKLLPFKTPDTRVAERAPQDNPARILSATLLRGMMVLERFFSMPSAHAFCGPTYCYRTPVCYTEGEPGSPVGSDFVIPCCSGRICGAPFGCLELCANGAKPFIWDPATNICAC